MVTSWRRAFCTSIPKERETRVVVADKNNNNQHCDKDNTSTTRSPRFGSKLGFFSNPSTPRLQSQPISSHSLRCRTITSTVSNSPKLHCKTNSPRLFNLSNPSSPKTPSSFSLLKASLRLTKQSRCGICLQSVKTGQGTAIFTAECSHTFHFPCIATHVKKNQLLTCPVCASQWNQLPIWTHHQQQQQNHHQSNKSLRVYNDDEPLVSSPVSLAHFNPIPESDEEDFQGFFVAPPVAAFSNPTCNVQTTLSPEAAVLAVSRGFETYAFLMKVKAPPFSARGMRRSPVDLVAVVDVSMSMAGVKLQMMKRAMRLVISSLGSSDRLSIVAFSAASKRLLPLRRMTNNGRRSARRIVDAIGTTGQGMSPSDALKKAIKVLEDRRERNPLATIILLSESTNHSRSSLIVSSTRVSHSDIPVHSIGFNDSGACTHAPHNDDPLAKCIGGLLNVAVEDLQLHLGFIAGSAPAEIAGVYTLTGRAAFVGSGSVRIGDLYAEEERELLIEMKIPTSSVGARHVLSVQSSYKDPSSQELINSREQPLLIPRPQAVRSSSPSIARLRNLHVSTRAVAESRRLIEVNDLSGAYHLLSSARALLIQSTSGSVDEFLRLLDSELAELSRRRQQPTTPQSLSQTQTQTQSHRHRINSQAQAEEKAAAEPLTPTSAWRAAERLAKVAIMRKHMNRVSDLHGFENARF